MRTPPGNRATDRPAPWSLRPWATRRRSAASPVFRDGAAGPVPSLRRRGTLSRRDRSRPGGIPRKGTPSVCGSAGGRSAGPGEGRGGFPPGEPCLGRRLVEAIRSCTGNLSGPPRISSGNHTQGFPAVSVIFSKGVWGRVHPRDGFLRGRNPRGDLKVTRYIVIKQKKISTL